MTMELQHAKGIEGILGSELVTSQHVIALDEFWIWTNKNHLHLMKVCIHADIIFFSSVVDTKMSAMKII